MRRIFVIVVGMVGMGAGSWGQTMPAQVDVTPERVVEVSAAAAKAREALDYETAAREQMILAGRGQATVEECMRVGDDWQLAENWKAAAEGYARALGRAEELLRGDGVADTQAVPTGGLQDNRGNRRIGGGGMTDSHRRNLETLRAGLILFIARIDAEKLNDGEAAEKMLERIVPAVPEFQGELDKTLGELADDYAVRVGKQEVPHDIKRGLQLVNQMQAMEALAKQQEALGRVDDAVLTLVRLNHARIRTLEDSVNDNMYELARLIERASPAVQGLDGAKRLVGLAPARAQTARKVRHYLEIETQPRGGVLTIDGSVSKKRVAIELLGAGTHTVEFANGERTVQCDVRVKEGEDCRVFENAGSPFAWTETNLGDFGMGTIVVRDVVKMADGRWLGALVAGDKVMLTTSGDLVRWDVPREFSGNGLGRSVEPAMVVDEKGEVWMAWHSNRLSMEPMSTAGYVLWISHSKDGVAWSAPREIPCNLGGWPMGSLEWVKAGGKYELLRRGERAMGASPGEIKGFEKLGVVLPERKWPMNPSAEIEGNGKIDLVIDDFLAGVLYCNSADGVKWSEPVTLVKTSDHIQGREPQLLIKGERAVVIYQDWEKTWMMRGATAGDDGLEKRRNPPVQIGGTGMTTAGSRWVRDGDGVVGFVGGREVWMLRAKTEELFGEGR